jgi:hypothetical protein
MLQVPRQRPVPRWSGLVIEPFVDRTAPRLGLDLDDLLRDPEAAAATVARRRFPPEAEAALAELRRAIAGAYSRLGALAPAIDPTLVRTMHNLRDRSLFAAEQGERKLVRALKRRDSDSARQVARLIASLRPAGMAQERTLTVATWLARHGSGFLGSLADAVADWYRAALERGPGAR